MCLILALAGGLRPLVRLQRGEDAGPAVPASIYVYIYIYNVIYIYIYMHASYIYIYIYNIRSL